MHIALTHDHLHLTDSLRRLLARLLAIRPRKARRLHSASDLSPWLQRDIGLCLRPDEPPRPWP